MVELVAGTIVDERFEIIDELGQGGMGVVYRARHQQMDKIVALKVLRAQVSAESDKVLRFKREAQVISVLKHPNILDIFAIGLAKDNLPYIAMEFLSGAQLSELLARDGPMGWRKLLPLMIEVCSALEYAHGKEIIHRDIKPSNIMVVDGHAKLVDFGIAKSVGESAPKLTQTNMLMGSVYYMSPGDLSGVKPGPHTDIYALGCTIFEMLTGHPPFAGDTVFDTMAKHSQEAVPLINKVNPKAQIPESLQALVEWMLAKSAEERIASVAEVGEKLKAMLAGGPVNVKKMAKPAHGAYRRLTFAVLALVVLIAVGWLAFSKYSTHSEYSRPTRVGPNLTDSDKEEKLIKEITAPGVADLPGKWMDLGNVYIGAARPAPAIACYKKGLAIAKSPKTLARLHNQLGGGYLMLADWGRATAEYDESAALNEKNGEGTAIQFGELLLCYVPMQRTRRAAQMSRTIEALIRSEKQYWKPPAEQELLAYAIEANIIEADYAKANELVQLAVQKGEAAHIDTRWPRALGLVARSYQGGVIKRGEIEPLETAQFGTEAPSALIKVTLAWAIAATQPDEALRLAREGIDSERRWVKPAQEVITLKLMEQTLRVSRFALARLPEKSAARQVLRTNREDLQILEQALRHRIEERDSQLPVD
jgi:serine/threonine protein kinase